EVGVREAAVLFGAPPRAEVHLVNRHRLAERLRFVALLDPIALARAPLVLALEHHRGGFGRELGLLGVGVGLEPELAVGPDDLVLVTDTRLSAGDEQLPDPARAERPHRMLAPIPVVEIA